MPRVLMWQVNLNSWTVSALIFSNTIHQCQLHFVIISSLRQTVDTHSILKAWSFSLKMEKKMWYLFYGNMKYSLNKKIPNVFKMFTCMWPEQKITIIIFNYYFYYLKVPNIKSHLKIYDCSLPASWWCTPRPRSSSFHLSFRITRHIYSMWHFLAVDNLLCHKLLLPQCCTRRIHLLMETCSPLS